jgi:hypothetical protein
MKNINWSGLIQSLVLVRLGQELGTDSPVARLVYVAIQLFLGAVQNCP